MTKNGSLVASEHALERAVVAAAAAVADDDGTAMDAVEDAGAVVVWRQSWIPVENANQCFLSQQFVWGYASLARRPGPRGSSRSSEHAVVSEGEESSYPQPRVAQGKRQHSAQYAAFPAAAFPGCG